MDDMQACKSSMRTEQYIVSLMYALTYYKIVEPIFEQGE